VREIGADTYGENAVIAVNVCKNKGNSKSI
jgi:hypothetical protein